VDNFVDQKVAKKGKCKHHRCMKMKEIKYMLWDHLKSRNPERVYDRNDRTGT